MVYLRKKVQKGTTYYQLVLDNGVIIQIGNASKILELVMFWRNNPQLRPKRVRRKGELPQFAPSKEPKKQG